MELTKKYFDGKFQQLEANIKDRFDSVDARLAKVESLTVSWSNAEGLATLVQGVLDGERAQYGVCNPGLDYRDHICLLCR